VNSSKLFIFLSLDVSQLVLSESFELFHIFSLLFAFPGALVDHLLDFVDSVSVCTDEIMHRMVDHALGTESLLAAFLLAEVTDLLSRVGTAVFLQLNHQPVLLKDVLRALTLSF
jgi:hypothetical protein